ncbi:MAG: chromosome partitioning protein, partial [Solirubrobacteraceae bacterium]|nr:chromosome partitioning protein [Solirubrobacteraceae bacterium]
MQWQSMVGDASALHSGASGRNRPAAGEYGAVMDSAQSRPRVIAFANQKGGVAKTTTTLNLAVAFVEKGFRVLCIDMDPQGNLTMSQGIDPDSLQTSMYDVLVHHTSLKEVIRKREVDIACSS